MRNTLILKYLIQQYISEKYVDINLVERIAFQILDMHRKTSVDIRDIVKGWVGPYTDITSRFYHLVVRKYLSEKTKLSITLDDVLNYLLDGSEPTRLIPSTKS